MRPPQIAKLKWLRPRNTSAADFAPIRQELERALAERQTNEVYSVNTRSIYQLDDPTLGPIAIKELRFETLPKRWRAAYLRRHRVLCEFNAHACFAARGGTTPRLYGGALEFRRGGIDRVFIVLEWLHGAVTLSEAMRGWSEQEYEHKLARLAQALADAAARGLVHGRHSSENILVGDPLKFYVIDFSHAQLFEHLQAEAFMRDVGRIGARLIIESACTREVTTQLFEAVANAVPAGQVSPGPMHDELEYVLTRSKRRQRFDRKRRTFWRGFPSRLRG